MAIAQPVSHRELSGGGSMLLDALRFGAACTVLFSHFGQPGFSTGFPDFTAAGHLAVAVFFVLSGFVIRYVTLSREVEAREYLIARAARIYSVVGPALAITMLCEGAAWIFYPRHYALLRQPFSWRDVPFQIGANLLFQAQNWGYAISPLSNGPFWSLSFECQYYAIYGFFFYRVPARWTISILLLLVAGPSIAIMFPVWLLGAGAFDAYRRLRVSRFGMYIGSSVLVVISLILFVARGAIHDLLVSSDDAHRVAWLSNLLRHVPHSELAYDRGRVPWLNNASASFILVGFITAVFVVWALLLLDRSNFVIAAPVAKSIRIVADSTFALYLLHLPLLILAICVVGRPIAGWWRIILVLGAIIVACFGLSFALDDFKQTLRLFLKRHLPRGLVALPKADMEAAQPRH